MHILVSGSAGFIGSFLCDYLLKCNFKVTGVDNCFYNNEQSIFHLLGNRKFDFVKGDVARLNFKNYDIIIISHGLVGMPICKKLSSVAWYTNAESIKIIVKSLGKDQKLIYPNSNSGYGTTDGKTECIEDSPMNPISVYGQSKCQGEQYALEHKNTTVLRLATVFGTSSRMRFDLLINNLFAKIYFDREITLFEPHFMRNFVHIRDVVRAMAWSIYNPNGVYNLGNDKLNMSKIQLAEAICDYLSINRSIIKIDESQKDEDQRNYIVSSNKIVKSGFTMDYQLEDGLNELCSLCDMYNKPTGKQTLLSMGNSC